MVVGWNRWRRDYLFGGSSGEVKGDQFKSSTRKTLKLSLLIGNVTGASPRPPARCGNSIRTVPAAPSSVGVAAAGRPLAAQITD